MIGGQRDFTGRGANVTGVDRGPSPGGVPAA
jgi:hypothetical protein